MLKTWLEALPDNFQIYFQIINTCLCCERNARFGRAMGGVILFLDKQFEQYLRNDLTSDCGIFRKKGFLNLDQDLILMFYVLTSTGFTFYDEVQINGMYLLEDIFVRLSSHFSDHYFLIMGDLNCRTGNVPDFQSKKRISNDQELI